MAHFAQLDENNVVIQVIVVANEDAPDEKTGQDFIASIPLEGKWIQTSYNTREGVHILGGVPQRYRYAGIGYYYDETYDAFIPPKPDDTESIVWEFNKNTLLWQKVKHSE
jgi:hypothetical protein